MLNTAMTSVSPTERLLQGLCRLAKPDLYSDYSSLGLCTVLNNYPETQEL